MEKQLSFEGTYQRMNFEDGKYTLIRDDRYPPGVMIKTERYREPWEAGTQQFVGNKFLHHMADRLFENQHDLERLRKLRDIAAQRWQSPSDQIVVLKFLLRGVTLILGEDPEPWVWEGQRFSSSDPAGQDFDFHPVHAPRHPAELERVLKEMGL